jgi:hypothetical protein
MATRGATVSGNLAGEIERCVESGKHYDTYLETDQQVLARITDGIYRQPASALRELIANAYDADARLVSITTDAPRFNTIKVSDDGIGMSPGVFANLVEHIGGSAKRTKRGAKLGITDKKDPTRSAGGRLLIGKIGIGLFSVAQLTRQFVIITKTAGTDYQLLAHVTLNRFEEAELAKVDEDNPFRAGSVRIWSEKSPDKKGHGTTIKLTTLLPRVVHILQSRDVWSALAEEEHAKGAGKRKPPLYHIGQIDPEDPDSLLMRPSYPWQQPADEVEKFQCLIDQVAEAWRRGNQYARLENALDNYFKMVWDLGLSLPIDYAEEHPFALTGRDLKHCYLLPDRRGSTKLKPVKLDSKNPRETVRSVAKLPDPEDSDPSFVVSLDGVRLARPIRFTGYPKTGVAHQDPVMFVGHATPDMSMIPDSQRGGPLSFSGYFFWVPRVIPQEHNGVLVRINGASGTLFDETFLKYQVAERRLSQLIAEVYVAEGLEGALVIDRESFNTAHPHYQVLANWVHNSLRLIRNTLKDIQTTARDKKAQQTEAKKTAALAIAVNELIAEFTDYDPADVPDVVILDDEDAVAEAVADGKIAYLRSEITAAGGDDKELDTWQESHAAAVARLLEAHGLLQDLDRADQAALVGGIVKLFTIKS